MTYPASSRCGSVTLSARGAVDSWLASCVRQNPVSTVAERNASSGQRHASGHYLEVILGKAVRYLVAGCGLVALALGFLSLLGAKFGDDPSRSDTPGKALLIAGASLLLAWALLMRQD